MDIKEYKGSISLEDFAEGLVAQPNKNTLGAVWEHTIDCNHCCFRGHCKDICDQIADKHDVNVYCRQVIDFLLGDKTIEDIVKEAD